MITFCVLWTVAAVLVAFNYRESADRIFFFFEDLFLGHRGSATPMTFQIIAGVHAFLAPFVLVIHLLDGSV